MQGEMDRLSRPTNKPASRFRLGFGAGGARARVAAFAGGLLLAAGLLGTGLASAGLPTQAVNDPAAPAKVSQTSKLYGQLDAKVNAGAESRLRVIVHLREQADLSTWPAGDRAGAIRKLQDVAARTQPQVVNAAQSAGSVNVYQRYWIFNGFAMEAPIAAIRDVAARDDVEYIVEDGYLTLPTFEVSQTENPVDNWNIYQVRAPEVWALGYDGTGRVVANLDSGVEGSHEALASRWRGISGGTPANSWHDPFGLSPNFPSDPGGHGTHTMGTIAGYQGDATGPNEIGQAKGAKWIAARNYDASGRGPFSYMHGSFQWFLDPDGNPNTNDQPDVVSNSWGDSAAYQYPDTEWWQDIEAWRAVGIIPVFSNGNNGSNGYTVGNPGAYPIVVGTGATDINRTIAGFSSRGPSPDQAPYNNPDYWERTNWGLIKPDVVAPGVAIRSSLPGNIYGNNQGTSMAAPHVAGLAGILRQIRPDLTYNEFYNVLIETAYWQPSFGTKPNNNYGWGEIDDYAAAVYLRDAGAVRGTITDSSCATAVAGVEVRVYAPCDDANANGECGIRKLNSDNAGYYRTILKSGTYTVTVSAPGYYGMNLTTTVMSSTTNTVPISLIKMPTGVVTGVITDGTSPVAGASVSINGLPNIRTTTNASGQYTLNNVPAGTFTLQAEMCGMQTVFSNVTVTYPGIVTRNLTMPAATSLLFSDFEDGALTGWTASGGSPTTAVWHNSTVRAFGGTHAARAGMVAAPYYYTGTVNTTMTTNGMWDTSAAGKVWLSFDLYDDAESEYDVFKAQISTDGGTTWPVFGANNSTVFGQASPVHGWQHICIDVTRWKATQMKLRFTFVGTGTNWNNEQFEGPSVDNVRISWSPPAGTPLVAMTPTPSTPIPCTPVGATATPSATTSPVATATPGACTISFADVPPSHTFYTWIMCLACDNVINGYACGGPGEPCNGNNDPYFRPGANITRAQIAKIVTLAANITDPVPPAQQTFEDVPVGSTFWTYIEQLAGVGAMSGYECGGPGEPCVAPGNRPYFRQNALATRGQLTKIVSQAAGYTDPIPAGTQTFEDVPEGSTFHEYVERLLLHNPSAMSGYDCGGPGEPCVAPNNRPYFRPANNVTRGQASKIVASIFYPDCGAAR